jgi:hypothetical protein
VSAKHGTKVTAIVARTTGESGAEDVERRAATLEELYAICRDAPPSRLIRVILEGEDGEVRLHFASFHRRRV